MKSEQLDLVTRNRFGDTALLAAKYAKTLCPLKIFRGCAEVRDACTSHRSVL